MNITISPLHVPSALDAPDASDFRAMVACGNAQWGRGTNLGDLVDEEEAHLLVQWQNTTDGEKIGLVARHGADPVAFGGLEFSTDTERTAEIWVDVAEHVEGTDVYDQVFSELERQAEQIGRTTLTLFTAHPTRSDHERLASPTGSGSVPRDDFAEKALRHGYRLQQVERLSAFDLTGPFDEVDALLREATAAAGEDYRVVTWLGATPEEYIDGYAAILQRMSTDLPAGEMENEEQHWDADRVRRRDDRIARAGRTRGVTIVVHEPTGAVAAFNDLVAQADRSRPTDQAGTLVLPEHRGRRLGSIVKCAGLRQWRAAVPESPCIVTWNAEENRFMLDVNERVGFAPVACTGVWEKKLRP